MARADPPARPIVLGRVGAPHGVRGWVRIQSYARPPESILGFARWLLDSGTGWRPRELTDSRITNKGLIARLDGCDDRDAALSLRHAAIAVERDELPELPPGEWYWADLEGLAVETVDGTPLGHVDHLLETGANDVLVVQGERERLIPWIADQVIREVDPGAGRLVVDWEPDF